MISRKTNRNFTIIEFEDLYGEKCSLQESSLARDDAIWFGQDKPTVVKDENGKEKYLCRMHLNKELVKELLPYLIWFSEKGYIPTEDKK